jgi:hypothetical protein
LFLLGEWDGSFKRDEFGGVAGADGFFWSLFFW